MISLATYPEFKAASTAVLSYLHTRLPFQMWMVNRVEGDELIVLQSHGNGDNVKAGDIFRWTDSYSSKMVQGQGPRIAPDSQKIPAYAAAPIGRKMEIGAYIGVPLTRSNGELFGTLCAIDPRPMQQEIESELPLVELEARLLMTILELEQQSEEQRRRAERASADAVTDSLTGLYNRRGWEQILAAENLRCQRYGHPTCLLSIDLDELKSVNDKDGHALGDALLRRAGRSLTAAVRETDTVARIGGDEFAVLAVECAPAGAHALFQRLADSLKDNKVSASIGLAMWDAEGSLYHAFNLADQRMFENKRQRKSSSTLRSPFHADQPKNKHKNESEL